MQQSQALQPSLLPIVMIFLHLVIPVVHNNCKVFPRDKSKRNKFPIISTIRIDSSICWRTRNHEVEAIPQVQHLPQPVASTQVQPPHQDLQGSQPAITRNYSCIRVEGRYKRSVCSSMNRSIIRIRKTLCNQVLSWLIDATI